MKKIIMFGICLLILFIPSFEAAAEASGKTQSEITFTQGPTPWFRPEPKENSSAKPFVKGILPHTGEQQALYLFIIGICLLVFIYLVILAKKKGKKEKE